MSNNRGFTLVELIVSLGLFAFVMSISTGAYLVMIASNRQAQAVATGINNLSYALDSMTRNMRTGSNYSCSGGTAPTFSTFSFVDAFGVSTSYTFVSNKIQQTVAGVTSDLTDPSVVLNSNSKFTCRDLLKSSADGQANVVMIVSGTVASGPGKTVDINLQTMATRRGVDL